jgi:hypothetical protein
MLFWGTAILLAAILLVLAWLIHGRPAAPSPFFTKLGDLILQLALVVIIGALVKALIDWGTSLHARHREWTEHRMDFLRRVRAIHLEVSYAQDLLNAHQSGKTYGERLRRLILLRGEIGEIVEDLRASPPLFSHQPEVMSALEGIIHYLDAGREEYIRCHADVAADAKENRMLGVTIQRQQMNWVRDFMACGPHFTSDYSENLDQSKGRMRHEVFGG